MRGIHEATVLEHMKSTLGKKVLLEKKKEKKIALKIPGATEKIVWVAGI